MPGSTTLARWIATWFGVGLVPIAPGTAGAIAALPMHWLLMQAGAGFETIGIVAVCCLGVWSAEITQRAMGEEDPQIVVVDEVAGMLIALLAAGKGHGSEKPDPPDCRSAVSGCVEGQPCAQPSTIPTARCGPACRVVWEGRSRKAPPYPD